MTDTTSLPSDDRVPAEPSVERLVADAAQAVAGVHALGAPAGRAVASAAARVSGRDAVPGVRVVALDGRTRIEVSFVADYPVRVQETAAAVRSRVTAAVAARIEGPIQVDVQVADVFGPLDRRREEAAAARAAKAQELKERAQTAAGDAKDRVQTAAGDAKDRVQDVAAATKDRVQVAAEDARDAARDAAGDAKAAAADARDQAQVVASDVRERAADTAQTVRVRVQEVREQAADRIEESAAKRAEASDTRDGDVVVEADAPGAPATTVSGETVVVVVIEPAGDQEAGETVAEPDRARS